MNFFKHLIERRGQTKYFCIYWPIYQIIFLSFLRFLRDLLSYLRRSRNSRCDFAIFLRLFIVGHFIEIPCVAQHFKVRLEPEKNPYFAFFAICNSDVHIHSFRLLFPLANVPTWILQQYMGVSFNSFGQILQNRWCHWRVLRANQLLR